MLLVPLLNNDVNNKPTPLIEIVTTKVCVRLLFVDPRKWGMQQYTTQIVYLFC